MELIPLDAGASDWGWLALDSVVGMLVMGVWDACVMVGSHGRRMCEGQL